MLSKHCNWFHGCFVLIYIYIYMYALHLRKVLTVFSKYYKIFQMKTWQSPRSLLMGMWYSHGPVLRQNITTYMLKEMAPENQQTSGIGTRKQIILWRTLYCIILLKSVLQFPEKYTQKKHTEVIFIAVIVQIYKISIECCDIFITINDILTCWYS